MRISSFKISNYKSFRESPQLQFSPGFNILVGQNNVGKSALLEALKMKFPSKPHKSLLSVPSVGTRLNQNSSAEVTLIVSGDELKDILLNTVRQFYVPMPKEKPYREGQQGLNRLMKDMFSQGEINFEVRLSTMSNTDAAGLQRSRYPACGLYVSETGADGSAWPCILVQVTDDQVGFRHVNNVNNQPEAEFGIAVAGILRDRIYTFNAERFNVGSSRFGHNPVLAPNAANLPEVLSVLQGNNPARFDRFNEFVRQVFPSIYEVSVRNQPNNSVEIVMWTEDPRTQREDLTIPLSEGGTGIGQVLAILYVVLTSDFPRTIIIDEPNSFLHPSAARKLIEILRRDFFQHQYIVSTHSSEIIRIATPATLTLIRWQKPVSVFEQLDSKKVSEIQKCLVEVGARLSDVFGADEILWVEGETEEECYRLILDASGNEPVGISIVAVRNTGDFQSKRPSASMIWDIYNKLSASNALMPPAVAFLFDREGRTEKEVEDLRRRSNGKVQFLPRRMYENYLILPEALAAVMTGLETFRENPITTDKIIEWLISNGGKADYIQGGVEHLDLAGGAWLANVDGAKLLANLFDDLSESKEQYRKTTHSIQLTEWLIKNKPEALHEISTLLNGILHPQVEDEGLAAR